MHFGESFTLIVVLLVLPIVISMLASISTYQPPAYTLLPPTTLLPGNPRDETTLGPRLPNHTTTTQPATMLLCIFWSFLTWSNPTLH